MCVFAVACYLCVVHVAWCLVCVCWVLLLCFVMCVSVLCVRCGSPFGCHCVCLLCVIDVGRCVLLGGWCACVVSGVLLSLLLLLFGVFCSL